MFNLHLPSKRWLALVGAVLVVCVGGAAVLHQVPGVWGRSVAAVPPASTPSPTPTFTPTVTPTPSPQPTATPRPRPTATPRPTVPDQNGNYLAVYVDYSYAGCHLGNGSKRPYPMLYFTNTFRNDRYVLVWGGSITNTGQFFLHGYTGSNIDGGQTETVEIGPLYGNAGNLSITIQTYKYPYSDVPGHWDGTVRPCS